MSGKSLFVYHPEALDYRFHDSHPFNQQRLVLTMDLLERAGALSLESMHSPNPAEDRLILQVHRKDYVEIVKALSKPRPAEEMLRNAAAYGLHSEDTPYFQRMHEVTARVAGGSVDAADRVMAGRCHHALHLAGGLHHAFPARGAGFCVYNDASVAISHIRHQYKARVLYVDTDVHHGDGVQWTYYTDPEVFTFSIHETGRYLFPGTGAVQERGEEKGFGRNINMPVEPYTEDESWLNCFQELLEQICKTWRPDVIVSQHGCDAHAYDPLAHIHCSMEIYKAMPQIIHRMAHEYCDGRWVALGGGGYDIYRVVPRAWSLLWLEMSDHPLIGELERDSNLALPADWVRTWQSRSTAKLPSTWLDSKNAWETIPRRSEINKINEETLKLALLYLK